MKNFGFGCMRLPSDGNKGVNYEEFTKMIDLFMQEGFNYFDTAHGYFNELSEPALKKCLVDRYPRESFTLTDKLSTTYFEKEEDIRPLFMSQLEICGVDYFDYYLMHSQTQEIYKKFTDCNAYSVAKQLKEEGYIKHFGISFHDKASLLDTILTEHPEVEVVQIQFNYVDYDDTSVQSRLCYEVCRKHNKPVIVMEPVKGGNLVRLPQDAKDIFDELGNSSYASYAIRYAASFEGIFMVLSGMSDLNQMKDNISFMKDFKPLNQAEFEAIKKVTDIFKSLGSIPCTACEYCVAGCPQNILIPDLFACLNSKRIFNDWNADFYYGVYTKDNGKASSCIECKACEAVCPQHLQITELLKDVKNEFEKAPK